jgi:DHA1 family bicyclomycin/chloramphenicol resistance-like MFS transporter
LIAVAIALMLPETLRCRTEASGFRGDVGRLITSRAFLGYMLCQVLASQIIFTFAGGGPYVVVTQMGRSSAEYGAWFASTGFAYLIGNLFCVRFAPRHSLERLIWFGLALQFLGAVLNLIWGIAGLNLAPSWLFGTQMLVMFANAFVMSNSAAGAISVRPEAAGTASGTMGFLQMGIGSLFSQFGAYLGGHFACMDWGHRGQFWRPVRGHRGHIGCALQGWLSIVCCCFPCGIVGIASAASSVRPAVGAMSTSPQAGAATARRLIVPISWVQK